MEGYFYEIDLAKFLFPAFPVWRRKTIFIPLKGPKIKEQMLLQETIWTCPRWNLW